MELHQALLLHDVAWREFCDPDITGMGWVALLDDKFAQNWSRVSSPTKRSCLLHSRSALFEIVIHTVSASGSSARLAAHQPSLSNDLKKSLGAVWMLRHCNFSLHANVGIVSVPS